jgi:hypothetical protein
MGGFSVVHYSTLASRGWTRQDEEREEEDVEQAVLSRWGRRRRTHLTVGINIKFCIKFTTTDVPVLRTESQGVPFSISSLAAGLSNAPSIHFASKIETMVTTTRSSNRLKQTISPLSKESMMTMTCLKPSVRASTTPIMGVCRLYSTVSSHRSAREF